MPSVNRNPQRNPLRPHPSNHIGTTPTPINHTNEIRAGLKSIADDFTAAAEICKTMSQSKLTSNVIEAQIQAINAIISNAQATSSHILNSASHI